jgi:hypothetical protein
MKTTKLHLFTIALLFGLHASGFAQGCSDAGFCTAESYKPQTMKSDSAEVIHKNVFKIGFSNGKADRNIDIVGMSIEYSRIFTKKIGLNLKLTGLSQSGKEYKALGLSDLYINGNYSLAKPITISAGIKLPFTTGSEKKGTIPLPMDYQTSLGTIDLIAGISYTIKNLKLVAAIQQPVSQNKNAFLQTNHDSTSEFYSFNSTNQYIRKGDVLLRIAYSINAGKKLSITPSLLPIYHLGNDSYTDSSGIKKAIIGSQGLTFNGNLFVEYRINKQNVIELSFGTPFITRKVRPDGLTRKYVIALEYKIYF